MTNQAPARPSFLAAAFSYIATTVALAFVVLMGYLLWPYAVAQWHGSAPQVQPTPAPAPARANPAQNSVSAPALSLEQISATSTAIYQATAAAVDAHPPNTNVTGDSAPLVTEQKPSVRQGAGENVPTSEPIVIPQSDEQTGSKPVLVNPQETHECRHGQVWVDGKGCKNP